MPDRPIVVWLRQDLRVADNPALAFAAASGRPVVPLYVLDDETPGDWRIGGAGRWWLHGSLAALAITLGRLGAPLALRRGGAVATVTAFARAVHAHAVAWNGAVEPHWRAADRAILEELPKVGVEAQPHLHSLLFEPGSITAKSGGPFKVFTPFWRACLAAPPPSSPLPSPRALRGPAEPPVCDRLEDWRLRPTGPDWSEGLRATWTPGETAALARLERFLDEGVAGYGEDRDRPAPGLTSRLSPALHWGEISPRLIWREVQAAAREPARRAGAVSFLREIGWREFYANVLYQNPELPEEPLQRQFAAFPFAPDVALQRAWRRGRTGYPIVDAGMNQLWTTGWMHNRVRMITASFFVKDLLQPWRDGAAWFWDTLVDADLANNSGGWQWVAGCGNDAAPFFRVFNPVLQGEKFDPDGAYVRRWVPALRRLPAQWVHRPWEAPLTALAEAGVRLGENYPNRLVDHHAARVRALAAFSALANAG